MMKKTLLVVLAGLSGWLHAAPESDDSPEALRQRIDRLERELNQKIDALAEAAEATPAPSGLSGISIGGYGELHYNNLDIAGEDFREIDMHRFVLFFGYEFSDRARLVSEFEVEHILASSSARGALELEQAYLEFDLRQHTHLQTGIILVPVGLINETHEPPRFYGVERPVVETTIIPTTWWSAGVKLSQQFDSGVQFDLMLSEGLKTEDPNAVVGADPFDLKAGKQKGSFAAAYDLATTARLRYTGVAGLELAAYAQYQPDLDQSAEQSYADDATLMGGHLVYQFGAVTAKALYVRWDLAGDAAQAAGKAVQDGGYGELGYRVSDHWGLFVRQSAWSQQQGQDATQVDYGVNFYPHRDIVFKVDVQQQNEDAGDADGFNLGMGYQF